MRIYFVSLGCDKNLVDSEKMLALLVANGHEITDEPEEADVIVVNTCAFIHDAKQESIETLIELSEFKKTGRCKKIIAAGCLAQRYQEEIREEMPEIDGIIGTTAYDDIVSVLDELMEGEVVTSTKDLNYIPSNLSDRVSSGLSHVGYLKISEGCNKNCSYCIIPAMRGRYRSVPMEELVEETVKLTAKGVKELIVVAQETTLYGVDLYGEKRLAALLHRLSEIEAIEWIRVLYCYPEEITEELAEEIASNDKICKYIDLPIQHSEDRVLKQMGRLTNRKELEEKIAMLREKIPGVALRTTLISGFPGETKEEHEACLSFVKAMRFDRLGVFPYSPEEGTRAAQMEGQIEDEVKRNRADAIMQVQQDVIFTNNENLIGKEFDVIVDGYLPEEQVYIGRTYADAPDVDGCVFFEAFYEIVSGTMVRIRVTDVNGYDLIGVMCEEG